MMDSDEWCGGAGDEDADLVEEAVHGVEVAVVGEGGAGEREEEGGGYPLVDGVFGDVNEEEGEHVREKEGAGAAEVG